MLLVSEDSKFEALVKQRAETAGFSFTGVAKGVRAMEEIEQRQPDLVFLDVKIPDMEGLAWLKMLRHTEAGKEIPVIVASHHKDEAEVAEAFEWGADDFILKSCDPVELAARIQAVLRRRFERDEQLGCAMSVGSIALDPSKHECRVRGNSIELKARQFELLEILMRKAGRVLSRVYLLEAIWGMSRDASTRAVDVGISRLRIALGRRAGSQIETVERFGYRLRNPE